MSRVYKMCDAGHMNIFEESEVAPRRCKTCNRNILQKSIFSLDDYKAQEDAEEETEVSEDVEQKSEKDDDNEEDNGGALFKLVNVEKNIEIILPTEEFILGREGVGAGVLPDTVSRKHLYVTPRARMGIRIVDKGSLNGTLVNGKILPKDTYMIILEGQTITLDVNSTGITLELRRV